MIGSATAENPWPSFRDGLILFPLKHHRAWLAKQIRGEPPRARAVADAVRRAAGGDDGSVRWPRGSYTRCWWLPAPVCR